MSGVAVSVVRSVHNALQEEKEGQKAQVMMGRGVNGVDDVRVRGETSVLYPVSK